MPVYEQGNDYTRLDYANKYDDLLALSRSNKDIEAKYWELHALWRTKDFVVGIKKAKEYENMFLGSKILNRYYNVLGELFRLKGDLKKSISYQNKAKFINEKSGNIGSLAATLNSMGEILVLKGEFRQALKLFMDSLQHYEHIGIAFTQIPIFNIARAYQETGELEKSYEFHLKSYNICKTTETAPEFLAPRLSALIQVGIMLEYEQTVENFLDELVTLNAKCESEIIQLHKEFAKALYLKNSKRIYQKVKGQHILENILKRKERDGLDFEVKIAVIPHFIELLMMEYHSYKEPVVMDELTKQLDLYYNIANHHNLQAHMVKSHLIRSRLEFVKGDWNLANEYFEIAKTLAREKNLEGLGKEIQTTELFMDKEYKESISKNTNFMERLEKMKLLDYIKKAQGLKNEMNST